MTIALYIIALCQIIRLVQNSIQLRMMVKSQQSDQMQRAVDAFIEDLNKPVDMSNSAVRDAVLTYLRECKGGDAHDAADK